VSLALVPLRPSSRSTRCGGQDAKNIEDIDVSKMKKLVVIDSTWQKAKTILRDER
jgi:DTW domain-containing protein YfiP